MVRERSSEKEIFKQYRKTWLEKDHLKKNIETISKNVVKERSSET